MKNWSGSLEVLGISAKCPILRFEKKIDTGEFTKMLTIQLPKTIDLQILKKLHQDIGILRKYDSDCIGYNLSAAGL